MKLRSTVAATALSAIGLLVCAPTAFAGSSSGVPYTDPAVIGSIGLCNKAGQQITHGSINAKPFAWRAVSSAPAKAPYNAAGRTATFYAYQPRQDVAAGEWSGEMLTASARYTDPAHPMAAATSKDYSLKEFISDFPPMWDGLIELRIYLGAPDAQPDSLNYPATNIKVTGNTWQEVGTIAPAACSSGRSESLETIVLPTTSPTAHHKKQASSQPSASASGQSAAGATQGATPSPSVSSVNAADSSDTASHRSLTVAIILLAVVLVAAGFFAAWRRRVAATPGSPTSDHRTSEKGR
jgi:hypothetical protein